MAFNLLSILIACSLLLSFTESQDTTDTECTFEDVGSNLVSYCDLDVILRGELKEKFDGFETFLDLIGKLARLIFHDCFGPKQNDPSVVAICDGCIDFDNPKHAGLPHEVEKINRIWEKKSEFGGQNWFNRISRADFWAAAATIAIQEAAEVGNSSWRMLPANTLTDTLPYIPFYIGRKDCTNDRGDGDLKNGDINIDNYEATKWIDVTNNAGELIDQVEIVSKSFGEATAGFDENYELFQQGFNIKPREYVALLGVHTLGRVNKNNSGFGNYPGKPWVEAWDRLDNAFYHMLLDDEEREKKLDWIQHETEIGGQFEWRDTLRGADGDTRFVMLNSDMALVKDLDNDDSSLDEITGECPYKTYGELANRPASRQHVVEFARNNQKWLNEFGAVFDRMIRAGYDNINRVPRDGNLSVLAAQWYLDQFKSVNAYDRSYCDHIVNYTHSEGGIGQKKWDGGEENQVKNTLNATLFNFVADHPECEAEIKDGEVLFLNYYYDYSYSGDTQTVTIRMIACCGIVGAVFDEDYTGPEGWKFEGFHPPAAGAGGFFDKDDPDFIVKQIIVFGIVGLILILCIIGGALFYKRYKTKKIELELEANQPISPGKDKKKKKKKSSTATVDVKTPIIDLEGGLGGNNGNSNSMPIPSDNPYIIPANSSIDQI
mmetsp:Transcript_58522/g.52741  ORF Transcript_58522/g.52741 Transcript_58522/m.52741 type:complete len:660 (+) Transcript_58522:85-2064(+)